MTLDKEDIALLEHALGSDHGGAPYRRYYVAPVHTSWHDQCERLTEAGLLKRFGEVMQCGQIYHVTEAGAQAVGAKLP